LRVIDINCDVGESFGRYTLGCDADVMPLISSANIACGFHASDPVVMRKTAQMAFEQGVSIGAHPGFPDLGGFGRRQMQLSFEELRDTIIYQVSALMGFAMIFGVSLQHVKLHGAMYNMAMNDENMGAAIVDALLEFDDNLIVFGLPGTTLLTLAHKAGLKVAREAFADRAYREDGTLASRTTPGAVITDSSVITERVLGIVLEKKITTITGAHIELEVDTICVHGDTPGAVEHVKRLNAALKREGIAIVPVKSFL
jgi:UPF0271 protein